MNATRQLKVYFSVTPANNIVVRYLRLQPGLRECEFNPLSGDPETRRTQLLEFGRSDKGPAAFIFGDGYEHGHSKHWTELAELALKISVDCHSDFSRVLHGSPPYFDNHMGCTHADGIDVIVPWYGHLTQGQVVSVDLEHTQFLGGISEIDERFAPTMNGYINYLAGLLPRFAGRKIALTIDADAIPSFPVTENDWLTPQGAGIKTEGLCALISSIGKDLFRLDFGGLTDRIPVFSLVSPLSLDVPKTEEAKSFAAASYLQDSQCPAQDLFDRVGSYVVAVYTKILEAFAGVHGYNVPS